MEKRNLKSTGFPDTDREILQRAFNEEFFLKLDEERAKLKERRRRAAQQAGLQRRRMLMEQTLQEGFLLFKKLKLLELRTKL